MTWRQRPCSALCLRSRRLKMRPVTASGPHRQHRHVGSLGLAKRLKIDVFKLEEEAKKRGMTLPPGPKPLTDEVQEILKTTRLPRAVQAAYLRPLRRIPSHGIPVCDLQLRSYSVRNLEFFADFALRAAYFLSLPAKGPVPLPRITERWTVPRDVFIFKKSQENFERITLRRLIQIQDGHEETVRVWLGFLQKHQYHGVGMKANTWGFEGLDVAERMEVREVEVKRRLSEKARLYGRRRRRTSGKDGETALSREKIEDVFRDEPYRRAFAGISREQ